MGEGPLAVQRVWSQLLREAERQGATWDFHQALRYETGDARKFEAAWKAWERSREEEREAEAAAKRAADARAKKEAAAKTAACTAASAVGTTAKKDEVKKAMSDTKGSGGKGAIESIVDTVIDTTKEDGADAAWRTAADEALEIGKPVAKQIVKEFAGSGAFAKKVLAAIDTPIGEGAVAWTMGWGIMGYGPLRGKALGAKTMRLSKELRVRGLKPITDAIGKKFIRPVSKRLTTLIEGLPSIVGED